MGSDNDTTQPSSTQVLGRYQILRRIGKGGMGDVWLAEDPSLHRHVAIKTLPTHSQNDREFSLRFAREAQAAAALNHPHILSIHDFGEQALQNGQSITYIVMPYIPGGSLADKIASYTAGNTDMPAQEAITYLQQAAEAIDYAHNQGVVHRDIKPANMLLRPDNWLLLADFGIARILSSQEQMTQAGVGIGTPEYMAPEQAQGKAEGASDNYSLAVIAYQLFTGRLPFTADTGYAMTIQHMITPPPSPRAYNPNLSSTFEMALLQGLAKEPQQRPPSARAFVAELQRSLTNTAFEPTYMKPQLPATLVVPMSTPDGKETHPETSGYNGNFAKLRGNTPIVTRRQLLIGGSAAAVLVAGGVGTWLVSSHNNGSTQPTKITNSSSNTPSSASSPSDAVLTIQAHNKPVSSLRWSPTAKNMLASAGSGGEGQAFLWDINALSQQKGQTISYKQSVQGQKFDASSNLLLAWSPDGNFLAVGNTHGDIGTNTISLNVYKSDLATNAPGYDTPIAVTGLVIRALNWIHGKYLIAIIDTGIGGPTQLGLWDTTQPTLRFTPATIAEQLNPGPDLVNERLLSIPSDGSRLALGLDQGVLVGDATVVGTKVKWQHLSNILKFEPQGFVNAADALGWTHKGDYILALNAGGFGSAPKIAEWNWNKQQDPNQAPPTLGMPETSTALTTLAISPKPLLGFIASGSKKGPVYIWDVNNKGGLPAFILNGISAEVTALAWSSDGKWLAASYNDTNASIRIWNIEGVR